MFAVAIVGVVIALRTAAANEWIRVTAMTLIVIGVSANILVMAANGGRMPVALQLEDEVPPDRESTYRIMDKNTRLAFLGDWIDVRDWLISPGDVCLYAGIAVAIAGRLVDLVPGPS
jgi:hypothetical protein